MSTGLGIDAARSCAAGLDELHEHVFERKLYVNDDPSFVAAEIEDDAVVADGIDFGSELLLDLARTCRTRWGCDVSDARIGLSDAGDAPRSPSACERRRHAWRSHIMSTIW